MLKVTRAKDLAAEEMDERCYFPLTNVDLLLPKKYEEDEPLIKRTYTVCDKESFLDWGLSSDYQMDEGEEGEEGSKHRTRDRSARPEQPDVAPLIRSSSQYSELSLPSAAQVRTFPAPPLHLPCTSPAPPLHLPYSLLCTVPCIYAAPPPLVIYIPGTSPVVSPLLSALHRPPSIARWNLC